MKNAIVCKSKTYLVIIHVGLLDENKYKTRRNSGKYTNIIEPKNFHQQKNYDQDLISQIRLLDSMKICVLKLFY